MAHLTMTIMFDGDDLEAQAKAAEVVYLLGGIEGITVRATMTAQLDNATLKTQGEAITRSKD